MARNMIQANQSIFSTLDRYCAENGTGIKNAGTTRWIETEPPERKLLKYGKLEAWTSFSVARKLARVDFNTRNYFCVIGLGNLGSFKQFPEVDLDGEMLTLLLSELKQQPVLSPLAIKNIVEFSNLEVDASYPGHSFKDIAGLFPPVKVFEAQNIAPDETWKIFFLLCLSESKGAHSWLEGRLIEILETLCSLDVVNIPFDTLCRSIFDSDPAALFLALYRCMEAVYAFSSANQIKKRLGVSQGWSEIASILEDEINWHPREESSLSSLMQYALKIDMERVYEALSENVPASASLAESTAKRIYKLRNILVHYRPTNSRLDYSKVDWNKLCASMASIVCDMYVGVFGI